MSAKIVSCTCHTYMTEGGPVTSGVYQCPVHGDAALALDTGIGRDNGKNGGKPKKQKEPEPFPIPAQTRPKDR